MKTCITCRQPKPLEEFFRRTASRDSHAPLCKACHGEYKRKWNSENRGRVRSKHLVRSRLYVMRNPDTRRETMRAYRVANREKVRAYNDDYAAKNPLVRIQIKQRYWARRKALPCERIDVAMFEAKLADYGFLCAYCQDRPYEHWDHVVPISKGGPHALSNLVPSCAHCNHTKWAHLWPAPAPPVMIASPS